MLVHRWDRANAAVPVETIAGVTREGGFFSKIIAVATPLATVRLRCFGAARFAPEIRDMAARAAAMVAGTLFIRAFQTCRRVPSSGRRIPSALHDSIGRRTETAVAERKRPREVRFVRARLPCRSRCS